MGLEDNSDDGGVGKRRLHKNQRLELTHLEGFKQAFDKEEPFQTVDGRQEHDDGFPRAVLGFLSAEGDVQVQVRPGSVLNKT